MKNEDSHLFHNLSAIDEYVRVNITLAAKQIAITARKKIRDGDVILTYGW